MIEAVKIIKFLTAYLEKERQSSTMKEPILPCSRVSQFLKGKHCATE